MHHRTVFFVSDQTGVTAETLGHSLLTQFDGLKFRGVTVPFLNTLDKAKETVRRINLTGEVEGARPIVFSTTVQDDVRDVIATSNGLLLDFFDAFIGILRGERELYWKIAWRQLGPKREVADVSLDTKQEIIGDFFSRGAAQ